MRFPRIHTLTHHNVRNPKAIWPRILPSLLLLQNRNSQAKQHEGSGEVDCLPDRGTVPIKNALEAGERRAERVPVLQSPIENLPHNLLLRFPATKYQNDTSPRRRRPYSINRC